MHIRVCRCEGLMNAMEKNHNKREAQSEAVDGKMLILSILTLCNNWENIDEWRRKLWKILKESWSDVYKPCFWQYGIFFNFCFLSLHRVIHLLLYQPLFLSCVRLCPDASLCNSKTHIPFIDFYNTLSSVHNDPEIISVLSLKISITVKPWLRFYYWGLIFCNLFLSSLWISLLSLSQNCYPYQIILMIIMIILIIFTIDIGIKSFIIFIRQNHEIILLFFLLQIETLWLMQKATSTGRMQPRWINGLQRKILKSKWTVLLDMLVAIPVCNSTHTHTHI